MADHKNEMRERVAQFLAEKLEGSTSPSPSSLAYALVEKFAVVERGSVEFHQDGGEWTGVYFNGNLALAHDHYYAGEWLEELVGVVTVQDSPYLEDGNSEAAPTLARVAELRTKALEDELAQVDAERERLIAEINAKHAEKSRTVTDRYRS